MDEVVNRRLISVQDQVHDPVRFSESPRCLINKQIYQEAIREWYGCTTYQAQITTTDHGGQVRLSYLGKDFLCDEQIPSTFYFIRDLKLTIIIDGYSDRVEQDLSRQRFQILNQCFLQREGEMSLESLRLDIICTANFWRHHLLDPDAVFTTIDRYLGPLQRIRGLATMTVAKLPPGPPYADGDEAVFLARKKKIGAALRDAVQNLRKAIVLPPGSKLGKT